ncbi:MAG: Ku protein [Xanthobacteraceae bacterium]|jgi:DNA end-binding protein Ku
MAPRPNWKGFLRLSLVSCPVALYPATSESEKISFNQINKATGHRIKYLKVDAETGEEVPAADIVKGYKVDTDTYVQVTQEEIDAILPESSRAIEIDSFVPRGEIDDLYLVRPYYIVPDGKIGQDAYAVIRETIREMDKVALARIVLTNREHMLALEPRGKGLMGTLLRYPYEVREASAYFDEIKDVKLTKDMLDLAKHIVDTRTGHFEPQKFEDTTETAMIELINRKKAGQPITRARSDDRGNVIDLMEALRRSLGKSPDADKAVKPAAKAPAQPTAKAKKPRKRIEGQTEMLLPIAGKGAGKKAAAKPAAAAEKKPARASTRRKAG